MVEELTEPAEFTETSDTAERADAQGGNLNSVVADNVQTLCADGVHEDLLSSNRCSPVNTLALCHALEAFKRSEFLVQSVEVETEAVCGAQVRVEVGCSGRRRSNRLDVGVLKDSLGQSEWFVKANSNDQERERLGHAHGVDRNIEEVGAEERAEEGKGR